TTFIRQIAEGFDNSNCRHGGDSRCLGLTPYHINSFMRMKQPWTGTFTSLVKFKGTNGQNPYGNLILLDDGNLYGTTYGGGTEGWGTFFKLTLSGTLTRLFSFPNGTGRLQAGVTRLGSDFWGVTSKLGGSVFRITPSGEYTHLSYLEGTSGVEPIGALTLGNDGNFYGTTVIGGDTSTFGNGCGTIFKITPQGLPTTIYEFHCNEGANPYGALTLGTDGNFYGTTENGGSNGGGTIFKVTPSGVLTTLVNFNGTNGSKPLGALLQASDGNFYGTTYDGGKISNKCNVYTCGTIFKVTPSGALTTLVNFKSTNGSSPYAGLTLGNDGSFYGTTYYGGGKGYGTVFKMTLPSGPLKSVTRRVKHR
ncbi:MAG: choice-of-anchor tandem repeat GloVer-containing protein, partial [Thermosynechococcaceae cyanobacterium]